MVASPADSALELRTEMIELLKQLNRAEMEEPGELSGLEAEELYHLLSRGAVIRPTIEEVETALRVLVGNRLALELDDPQYAWNRGRVVGNRFAITTEGKQFLVHQLQRVGRV
jgi:hypothetical protein